MSGCYLASERIGALQAVDGAVIFDSTGTPLHLAQGLPLWGCNAYTAGLASINLLL